MNRQQEHKLAFNMALISLRYLADLYREDKVCECLALTRIRANLIAMAKEDYGIDLDVPCKDEGK